MTEKKDPSRISAALDWVFGEVNEIVGKIVGSDEMIEKGKKMVANAGIEYGEAEHRRSLRNVVKDTGEEKLDTGKGETEYSKDKKVTRMDGMEGPGMNAV